MKKIAAILLFAALVWPALGQDPVRIVVNLSTKEVTSTNVMAIRERVPVLIESIGTAQPSNMVARITDNEGLTLAFSAAFTNSAGTAAGVLDLNTEELAAFFTNASPQAARAVNFGLWDVAQGRLLVNTKIVLQNNPYRDGMPGPSTVGTLYLMGSWEASTNTWMAGRVVQAAATPNIYRLVLPDALIATATQVQWGAMVGSLDDQTDLAARLDGADAAIEDEAAARSNAVQELAEDLAALPTGAAVSGVVSALAYPLASGTGVAARVTAIEGAGYMTGAASSNAFLRTNWPYQSIVPIGGLFVGLMGPFSVPSIGTMDDAVMVESGVAYVARPMTGSRAALWDANVLPDPRNAEAMTNVPPAWTAQPSLLALSNSVAALPTGAAVSGVVSALAYPLASGQSISGRVTDLEADLSSLVITQAERLVITDTNNTSAYVLKLSADNVSLPPPIRFTSQGGQWMDFSPYLATLTFYSGQTIKYWTSNNDGMESGLDADLVRGSNPYDAANLTNIPSAWTTQPSLLALSNSVAGLPTGAAVTGIVSALAYPLASGTGVAGRVTAIEAAGYISGSVASNAFLGTNWPYQSIVPIGGIYIGILGPFSVPSIGTMSDALMAEDGVAYVARPLAASRTALWDADVLPDPRNAAALTNVPAAWTAQPSLLAVSNSIATMTTGKLDAATAATTYATAAAATVLTTGKQDVATAIVWSNALSSRITANATGKYDLVTALATNAAMTARTAIMETGKASQVDHLALASTVGAIDPGLWSQVATSAVNMAGQTLTGVNRLELNVATGSVTTPGLYRGSVDSTGTNALTWYSGAGTPSTVWHFGNLNSTLFQTISGYNTALAEILWSRSGFIQPTTPASAGAAGRMIESNGYLYVWSPSSNLWGRVALEFSW